jgi:hypothetical protein
MNYGQLKHMVQALELAAANSQGHANKTIQAEINDGMKNLVQLVTDALSESVEDLSENQADDIDYDLDNLYKKFDVK